MRPLDPSRHAAAGHPLRVSLRIARLRRRVRATPASLPVLREFVVAFCACLVAASAFLA